MRIRCDRSNGWVASIINYHQCFIFLSYNMKEIIKQSTITETIDGKEFTVIISKWEDGYYWLLRMWTKIPWDYKDVKDYFTAIFKKLSTDVVEVSSIKVTRKVRADKWKTHNYPAVTFQKVHKWRPKGKPRWPKKGSSVDSTTFINKYLKK